MTRSDLVAILFWIVFILAILISLVVNLPDGED